MRSRLANRRFQILAGEHLNRPAQIDRPGTGFLFPFQFLKHTAKYIDSVEDGVDPRRRHRQVMRAKLVQKVFQIVGPTHEVLGIEEACPALDVRKARKIDASVSSLWGPIQGSGCLAGHLQQFSRFNQIIVQKL